MNTLYISYDGMTDPLGQSQVLPYLEGLAKLGHNISLISAEKPEKENDKARIGKIISAAGIEWFPIEYTKKPPVFSTIRDIRKMMMLAEKIYREKNIETVHCRSYVAAIVGEWMKRNFGVKFIFDMRGFWADERVEGNIWNLKNPIFKIVYNYFKKKEKQFFENADAVISLTENGKQEIHSWNKLSNQPIPIEVIPCCVDMNLFDSKKISVEQIEKKKAELGLNNSELVISYSGSIGTWYLCDEMLEFFSCLQKKIPSAKFLFITPEEREFVLQKARAKNISEESIVLLKATRNEMPILLKCADFSLFFIKPSYSKKASSPVKQGEIMSMGIPIICNSGVGDTAQIVKESNAGFVLDKMNDSAFNKVIERINELKNLSPVEIRNGAGKFYSLEKGIEKYHSVYKKLST